MARLHGEQCGTDRGARPCEKRSSRGSEAETVRPADPREAAFTESPTRCLPLRRRRAVPSIREIASTAGRVPRRARWERKRKRSAGALPPCASTQEANAAFASCRWGPEGRSAGEGRPIQQFVPLLFVPSRSPLPSQQLRQQAPPIGER